MIRVNLLSPEKKEISGGAEGKAFPEESRQNKISTAAIVFATLLTLGTIAFLYFTQASAIDDREKLLIEKQARKDELDNVLKQLDELENAKSMVDKKIKLISELKSRQQDTVKMMDQLCNAIPDWVWLQSLTFSGKLVNIQGKAIHNNLISDFINNLKGTGCFDDVQFPGSVRQTQSGQDVFDFRLTFLYKDKDEARKDAEKESGAKKRKG